MLDKCKQSNVSAIPMNVCVCVCSKDKMRKTLSFLENKTTEKNGLKSKHDAVTYV